VRGRRREPPRLVLEDLPAAVRPALDAMMRGQEVQVVRGERSVGVATFRSTVVEAVVVVPGPRQREPRPADSTPEGATVVATAVPMSADARRRLSDAFGDGYVVLDVNAAPDTADVVLTHPVSPQLLGMLRARFRQARIIITEVDDDELGISQVGPVSRLLDAGASAYLPPRPLDEVAGNVRTYLESAQAPEITRAEEHPRSLP
jgi:hypothetical protein